MPNQLQIKIVIADDSVTVQNTIQRMLLEETFIKPQIFMANDGSEACILVSNEKPDLILMDIEMPVMSGVEAIRKIKSNSAIKHIPIIVMSSSRQFEEAIEAGADDFLLKPFNRYELNTRIHLNVQLAEKRHDVKKKQELLKLQRQEAIAQRDTIQKQQNEMMKGLEYARFVQKATQPSSEIMDQLFHSYFVYNKPKNVVSGDFYWVNHKKEFIYIAVGDCTGHGMSGALMSMAGTAFLNEIILKNPYISADQVLNELRDRVINLLNQKGESVEATNGMDIALCIYNDEEKVLQFAGANNPILFASKNEPLEIIKGDRMPIGFYFDDVQPFTLKEKRIEKGDLLYMYTDGYSDQFGGPLGQKLRHNRFRDLVEQAAILNDLKKQHDLLHSTMEEWIDGFEQVDDMLILGVKFL